MKIKNPYNKFIEDMMKDTSDEFKMQVEKGWNENQNAKEIIEDIKRAARYHL